MANQYPTVLVHGFLGAGGDSLLAGIYSDFGAWGKNVTKAMNQEGYEVYQPGVGPINSVWDRACILWAYLVGGRVDFGKVHSEKNHHERYGRTYPGVLRDWGTAGNHAKINLIGHSFGGPTVCLFSSLLVAGCKEEQDGTPANELSELFKGGHESWLHTVTTLSGTNNGSSVPDALGTIGRRIISSILYGFGVLYCDTRLVHLMDFQDEHFHLMEDPAKIRVHHLSNPFSEKSREAIRNITTSNDDIMLGMSVAFSKEMAEHYVIDPHAYYFARRACKTQENDNGHQVPKPGIQLMFRATVPIIDRYRNKDLGIDDTWAASDGIVPIPGMNAPVGMPKKDWDESESFKPGIWYQMPVEGDKDHQSFMGMGMKKANYYAYFRDMLNMFRELPDA